MTSGSTVASLFFDYLSGPATWFDKLELKIENCGSI